ncbi:MAG: ATP-binding cassette domain-containing protein, partial [Nitrospirae bacterium]|nr:ATP-binding cassette domain-containing protein [Candidatus Manganitrophaceae bacterium]
VQQALAPEGGEQVIFQGRVIHIVSWAKRFLFTADQLGLPVSRLSGGEQARLLIAHLMLKPADLLLLDEPSNDLDIPTLEVLEESLEAFPGAIVLITHDRYLLERLSDVLLSLNGDGSVSFHADLVQWRRAQQNKSSIKTTPKIAQAQKQATLEVQEKLSFEERKELKRISQKIEKAEAKVAAANEALQDPAIQSDAEVLIARTKTLQEIEAEVAKLYTRWEDLENRNT